MIWILKNFVNLTWYDIKGLHTCSLIRYLIWGIVKGIVIVVGATILVVIVAYALIGSLVWAGHALIFNPTDLNPVLGIGLLTWILAALAYGGIHLSRGLFWLSQRFEKWLELRYERERYNVNVEDIKEKQPNVSWALIKSYHSKICRRIEIE